MSERLRPNVKVLFFRVIMTAPGGWIFLAASMMLFLAVAMYSAGCRARQVRARS
jgi:hypothetical protein